MDPTASADLAVRHWGRRALKAYPIVALALYVLQYTYAFQYLLQFGVAPEELGVSQLKFATRAALFGLVVLAVYGGMAFIASLVLVIREFRAEPPWRPPKGERGRHLHSYVVLGVTVSSAIVARLLGGRFEAGQIVAIAVCACVAFLLTRKQSRRLSATVALCVTVFGALSWAAYAGGARAGNKTAETGVVSPMLAIFGVDVRQIAPTWLVSNAQPPGYHGQDLLDLGSEGGTIFLYDCDGQITRRVPLTQVALDYSLARVDDARLSKRLACRG